MSDTTKYVKANKKRGKTSTSKDEQPPKRAMMDPSIKTQEVLVDTSGKRIKITTLVTSYIIP